MTRFIVLLWYFSNTTYSSFTPHNIKMILSLLFTNERTEAEKKHIIGRKSTSWKRPFVSIQKRLILSTPQGMPSASLSFPPWEATAPRTHTYDTKRPSFDISYSSLLLTTQLQNSELRICFMNIADENFKEEKHLDRKWCILNLVKISSLSGILAPS